MKSDKERRRRKETTRVDGWKRRLAGWLAGIRKRQQRLDRGETDTWKSKCGGKTRLRERGRVSHYVDFRLTGTPVPFSLNHPGVKRGDHSTKLPTPLSEH